MTQRRIIDTNLVVRYLVQDHPKHAKTASKLFEACDAGRLKLMVLPAVLAECVFVLGSFYEHSRIDIARALHDLITSHGVEMSDLDAHVDALARYRDSKAHFVDCVIAAHATASGLPVVSFDADFRKFPDVRVEIN